ncbi:MAG TPA: AI-2E family transporter [Mycobacteriales bacterium]
MSEQRPGRTRVDGTPDPTAPADQPDAADQLTPPADQAEPGRDVTTPADQVAPARDVTPPADQVAAARDVTPPADQPAAAGDVTPAADRPEPARDGDAREQAIAARERAAEAQERAERARADAVEAAAAADAAEAAAAASAETGRPGGGLGDVPPSDPVVNPDVRAEEAGVDEENPLGRPGRPMNRRSPFRIGFAGAVGAGFAYLLYQALVSARGVLVLVIVAAFLAIGLNPIVSRLERAGMRRGAAVAVVFAGLLGFFALFGYAVLPPVITQVSNFVDAVPHYVKDLQGNATIRDLDRRFGVIDKLNQYVTTGDFGTRIAGNVVSVTQEVAGFVLKSLTVLILTLYFLSSFNAIKRTAYRLVPRTRRARFSLIGDEVLGRVGGYVAGAVVVALIAGVTSLIWVSSLGIPYPLALALIVTLTDVIPLIGATLGALLVSTVAFFVSLPVGIATFAFFIVYQQLENYFIYPRVMSRSVDVNPAAAIVGALIGGTLLGFVGALLAVPATAAIQLILREVLVPRQDAQ